MSNLSDSPQKFLQEQLYDQFVEYYERLVEDDPENLSHYWNLGLGYLLQSKEEQAQLTWFIALNQQEGAEFEAQLENLVQVLDDEAIRQEQEKNIQLAWLIRGHIRELMPSHGENFLRLVCLDIKLTDADIDQFETWNLTSTIESLNSQVFQTDILVECLKIILCLPCPESLKFARYCLNCVCDPQPILLAINDLAGSLANRYGHFTYAADLIRVCQEITPDYLILLKSLCWFTFEAKQYDEAVIAATKFFEKANTPATKIFANHQFLSICLKQPDWFNLFLWAETQINMLTELADQENMAIDEFMKLTMSSWTQPLLYIQDKPRQNRYLFNKISHRFQNELTNSNPELLKDVKTSPPLGLKIKDRPLKIGYISRFFKYHSVAWLARWLVYHQNKDDFELYIYSMTEYEDSMTVEWFKQHASKSYSFNFSARKAIHQIWDDGIDILVDIDSVTANITCQVMALKPAPIQVTWLGLDASGIPAIDYFIADPYVLPDNAQEDYSEKIWRLPHTYLGIDGFEVGIPTLSRENLKIEKDAIIFMNIQGTLKLHPDILRLQLQIIKNVPHGYLLVKGSDDNNSLYSMYERLTAEAGVKIDCLRFIGNTPTELQHRANLGIADVMLDTYPYNGATTTLETLWMEIPVVTRVGEQFAARNSYTFMINAGITEGIAWTDEEYVEWGIRLGTDENLRKEISWKLKQSKKTSPLWDGKQFARDMEDAYRQMWEIYVKQNSGQD